MNTLNLAKNQAIACLQKNIPPGTVRQATPEEIKQVENLIPYNTTLETLEASLKTNPEGMILLKPTQLNWNTLLKCVLRSGASSTCRVLVI